MIYHVFANRSNAGDWLSAQGIQKLLRPLRSEERLCDRPFAPETLARLEQARQEDFIVIGGGGLFMDYFQPFWEGFLPIARRVPFCLWGLGCCQMKWEDTRPPAGLIREIVHRSRLCVVRDELTREYLAVSGMDEPIPCPSLAVLEPQPAMGSGVLHVASYEADKPEIYEATREAAQQFANRTGRVFREINNRIPDGNASALGEAINAYARSDVVVSARLHGCIIALGMGRKVLAVSSDRKIESFMRAAGLGDWVVDYTCVAELPERLSELPRQQPPLEYAAKAVTRNRAVAARVFDLVQKGEAGT